MTLWYYVARLFMVFIFKVFVLTYKAGERHYCSKNIMGTMSLASNGELSFKSWKFLSAAILYLHFEPGLRLDFLTNLETMLLCQYSCVLIPTYLHLLKTLLFVNPGTFKIGTWSRHFDCNVQLNNAKSMQVFCLLKNKMIFAPFFYFLMRMMRFFFYAL